ncbi:hypothetical protein XI25_15625 [Paenibacillus sp. DMB20]|nr:hypothetical protein XI25_15625 [Paenibacillus sp. DMB20]
MTGTNYRLAEWASEGGREQGAEVKVLRIPELASEEGKLWFHGKLINKVVSAMTSAPNPHHQAKRTVTVAEWKKISC